MYFKLLLFRFINSQISTFFEHFELSHRLWVKITIRLAKSRFVVIIVVIGTINRFYRRDISASFRVYCVYLMAVVVEDVQKSIVLIHYFVVIAK